MRNAGGFGASLRGAAAVLVVLGGMAAPGGAAPTGKVTVEVDWSANGDARTRVTLEGHLVAEVAGWAKDDPRGVAKQLAVLRGPSELDDVSTVALAADGRSLTADVVEQGIGRSVGRGLWEAELRPGLDLVTMKEEAGRTHVLLFATGWALFGASLSGRVDVVLPKGAEGVEYDARIGRLRWRLPWRGPSAGGRLTVDVRTKDRLMSGLYKVYGAPQDFPDQWVARAVVRNVGSGPASEVAFRFRLSPYAEWSAWTTAPEMVPGQTLVAAYHPRLAPTIAALQSSTPLDLAVEWRWRDGDGDHADGTTRQVTFLGGREFVFSSDPSDDAKSSFHTQFSNAPFLAAWVSRDDPVVKQFAGMVSHYARGAAANLGNDQAVELLRSAYEILLLNDFVYTAPVAIADPTLSFDNETVQNVKLPRDVLRDKSGTCIELAIFHAAVAHALGIRPVLAIVPGHCFPVFRLQGDAVHAFEATGIRGGLRVGRVGFEESSRMGQQTLEHHRKEGTLLLVDVAQMWGEGVGNPELEPLAPDALVRWGVTERGVPGVTLPDLGASPARTDPSGFEGTWTGRLSARFGGPHAVPCTVLWTITAGRAGRFKVLATFTPEGDAGGRVWQEDMIAEDQEGQLVFQGTRRTAVDTATKAAEDITPGRGAARVKDGRLVGQYGADGEGFSAFALERQR